MSPYIFLAFYEVVDFFRKNLLTLNFDFSRLDY